LNVLFAIKAESITCISVTVNEISQTFRGLN